MRRTFFLLCLPVFGLGLLLTYAPGGAVSVKADDKKPGAKDADKPPTIDAHDLEAAKGILDGLSDREYAAVCAAHYLMQPSIEEGLFKGRVRNTGPLEPFEQAATGELSPAEMLRLWALIDAGLPDSDAMQKSVSRLLKTTVRRVDIHLARSGAHMLALTAARARLGNRDDAGLLSDARSIVAASERQDLCSEKSDWYTEQGIGIEWFANQFWRAVINRCAVGLGLKVNYRRWGEDLRLLESAFVEGEGWTSRKNKQPSTYESERLNEELHTNLLAIATIGLAKDITNAEFSPRDAAELTACAARAPGVLAGLIEKFEDLPLNGVRLLLILASKFAPSGKDAIAWRTLLLEAHCREFRASGLPESYSTLPGCLGFHDGSGGDESLEEVAELALGMVAGNGGLCRPQAGPFATRSLGEVGRLLWARTIKLASEAPELSAIVGHKLPKPEPITDFMVKGLKYIAGAQDSTGGWAGGGFGGGRKGQPAAPVADPATTAFCALALMRSGSSPRDGAYRDQIQRALDYILKVVEEASADGPKITTIENTQAQRKLGPLIDTSMAAQFLARAVPYLTGAAKSRAEKALDKCLRKIEASQDEDGSWNKAGGWAPVLQSAMMNQALELADLCGRKPDKKVLEKSRGYYCEDETSTAPGGGRRDVNAGVVLYSGSATQRVAAKDVREAEDGIQVAIQMGKLSKGSKVNEDNLVRAGFTRSQAKVKAGAWVKFAELNKKLDDPAYLKGFGNNGGEEFISFMLCSESLVITGGEEWKDWNTKMHETYKGIQNGDGSWSGHHCITSPVICTAATLLCLMADREVHVKIEPSPLLKKSDDTETAPPIAPPRKDGPVTGD